MNEINKSSFNGHAMLSLLGIVYVFTDGDLYKIGITRRISDRIKQVRNASGKQLRVIMAYHCESPRKHERSLHDFFARYRVCGEWFKIGSYELGQIDTYFDNQGIRPQVLNIREF